MPLTAQAPPFDLLLDRLPDNYAGYLIRTDYRIGIQISLCLQDDGLTQEERVTQAVWLLFGSGAPPLETALEGLSWYLSCGQPRRDDVPAAGTPQRVWFDYDHARIVSSFYKSFGMKVHRETLHWFEFMALLDGLDEDSALSNAIQLRGTDTAKLKGRHKSDVERAKRLLTPPVQYSEEEQAAIEDFFGGTEK